MNRSKSKVGEYGKLFESLFNFEGPRQPDAAAAKCCAAPRRRDPGRKRAEHGGRDERNSQKAARGTFTRGKKRERPGTVGKTSWRHGGIAQLGERLLCKQEVNGSIPFISTSSQMLRQPNAARHPAGEIRGGNGQSMAGESKDTSERRSSRRLKNGYRKRSTRQSDRETGKLKRVETACGRGYCG
jgi:hypothetical protein